MRIMNSMISLPNFSKNVMTYIQCMCRRCLVLKSPPFIECHTGALPLRLSQPGKWFLHPQDQQRVRHQEGKVEFINSEEYPTSSKQK